MNTAEGVQSQDAIAQSTVVQEPCDFVRSTPTAVIDAGHELLTDKPREKVEATRLASNLSENPRGDSPLNSPEVQFNGPIFQYPAEEASKRESNDVRPSWSAPSSPVRNSFRRSRFLSVVEPPIGELDVGEVENSNQEAAAAEPRRRRRKSRALNFLGAEDSQEPLQDRLIACMEKSLFDRHRKFIPEQRLCKLFTADAVEVELKEYEQSFRRKFKDLTISGKRAPTPRDVKEDAHRICGLVTQAMADWEAESGELPNEEYRKVYAILLLINKQHRISAFIEARVCDKDLPLIRVSKNCPKLARADSPEVPLDCFKKWSATTLARFEEKQWAVVAPVFKRLGEGRICHEKIHRDAILPFTSWEPIGATGGFGRVYRTTIHCDHHPFNDDAERRSEFFAVKELFTDKATDFEKEVRILQKLSREPHSHPNLITLLGTFQRHDSFYLIFPCAEVDLLGYWKIENPRPTKDKDTALWLAEQSLGLAQGLNKIHQWPTFSGSGLLHISSLPPERPRVVDSGALRRNSTHREESPRRFFGRHGDIKPKNILWFSNGGGQGVLKITDFGIAHFSTKISVPAKSRGVIANSLNYRAPECDLPDWKLSSSADIWALGCVYLEFIAWFFGGWELVHEFSRQRLSPDRLLPADFDSDTFFLIKSEGSPPEPRAERKFAVEEMIKELRSTHAPTGLFHDFVGMIQQSMLCVQQNDFGDYGVGRKSSGQIAIQLGEMLESCNRDPNYIHF